METFIHPSAIIDPPARIGAGTKIWHFCHIMSGAEIGRDCNLGQNVFVASGVKIGDGCKIQNNVSLYEGVELEEGVFCGPSMVFTNVKNPRAEVVRRGEYTPTRVGRGVTFGANCTVICGTRIGRYAFIAAGAVVTADVPPFALVAGVPARQVGWAGRRGVKLEEVTGEPGVFRCPESGERYTLEDCGLRIADCGLKEARSAERGARRENNSDHDPSPRSALHAPHSPVPLLDLKAQYRAIAPEIEAALRRVVESQGFILGPEVEAFEAEAAAALAAPHAIGCASGSDALLLALMALELPAGGEVITTPYTFFATAGSIARLGLRPVFVDIDPATYNLDPAAIESKITPRTRAIIPVHLYGQCAAMAPILAIAARHGLVVIEDAAQAIGARDAGRPAGTMGAVGCFSFFPSKNLGGFGDGGLLTTADPELARRLRLLRVHGSAERYLHERVGINSRLDALQAAVLRVKLPYLEGWNAARAANAARYRELFREAGLTECGARSAERGVTLPHERAGAGDRHVYNQFVIRVPAARRDPLRAALTASKIGTAIYYPLPLHLQPCFADLGGKPGDFPAAEAAAAETLALPVYPELTPDQQVRVVAAIGKFMKAQGA